jgi:hypothetical protein
VIAIAAGGDHNLALRSNGTVVAWGGSNDWDQLDVPEGLSGVIAIAAGPRHNLALKSDGTVVAWGFGWTGFPAMPMGATAIAAGDRSTLTLLPEAMPATGRYRIQNLKTGLVLGVLGASTSEGADIVQWNSNGSPDQEWTLTPAGNGAYTITNVKSGMVIAKARGNWFLEQLPANGSTEQLWRFAHVGPNYWITHVKYGNRMSIEEGDYPRTGFAYANHDLSQQWALIRVQ